MSNPENTQWQLSAITEALGDLVIDIDERLTIGRGKDNDVVLGSKQVSRNHAEINVLNGLLYVKDLNSSNGTFINDERIAVEKSRNIKSGDTLSFATFGFTVNDIGQQSATSPAVDSESTSISDSKASNETPVTSVDKTGTQIDSNLSKTLKEGNTLPETSIESAESEPLKTDGQAALETQDLMIQKDKTAKVPTQPLQTSITPDSAASDSKAHSHVDEEEIAETQLAQSKPEQSSKAEPSSVQDAADSNASYSSNIKDSALQPKPAIQKTEDIMPKSDAAPSEGKDKTTTTELQREVDPDVLRAKQAATAQMSGTANLGEDTDIGTKGNNTLSQAEHNPATHPSERKASGSWFIWVFIAIIIIAGIVWMLNVWILNSGS